MQKSAYKKYSLEEQRLLAVWAAECAERVLSFFERVHPHDDRPRQAIEAGQAWVCNGLFKMSAIRGASLAAHAAARECAENSAARFAARAAGQAVATAHVSQHAYGSAYYALKAVAAAAEDAETEVAKERDWQSQHLPDHLRKEVMSRILVESRPAGIFVKLQKDEGF